MASGKRCHQSCVPIKQLRLGTQAGCVAESAGALQSNLYLTSFGPDAIIAKAAASRRSGSRYVPAPRALDRPARDAT